MPILGTIASSTRQGQATDLGAMFPLQVITVGAAGASSVTFTNIPQTYTHLQLRCSKRGTATSAIYTALQFNSVTTGNLYGNHELYGDGSAAGAQAYITRNDLPLDFGVYSTQTANVFDVVICDILDYTNTNKNKTTRSLTGYDINGAGGIVSLQSGLFRSTSAISSLTLFPSAGNYAQYSQFALYGVKSA